MNILAPENGRNSQEQQANNELMGHLRHGQFRVFALHSYGYIPPIL